MDCRKKTVLELIAEAVSQRCPVKKVLLKIPQNWQESTCARAFFISFHGNLYTLGSNWLVAWIRVIEFSQSLSEL